jgi:hypothetical protein
MTKRFFRLAAVACALGQLIACRAPRSDFSYLNAPTVYELAGEVEGLAFRATLAGAGRDRTGERPTDGQDFVLLYHEPPALAGMSVIYTAASDRYEVRLGEVAVDGEAYAALGEVGHLLLTERAVERREDDGAVVRIVGTEGVVLEVDEADGRPLGIRWRRGACRVVG